LIKEFFCRVFYFIIAIPILAVLMCCWFGLKIVNRGVLRKLRKSGAVAVCNHIHQMDSPICAVAIPWRKLIYVSRPDNFDIMGAGFFVDALGSVPAPSTPKELQVFIYSLSRKLRKRRVVLFFPEGERVNYNENLQSFQRGAFYLAVDARNPVLPIRIQSRKPDGLLKFIRKKPCFTLTFGEPLYPDINLSETEAVDDLKERAEKAMS
jgi:1-acyl-sn-glycerol-3-phosphate acyltransferase